MINYDQFAAVELKVGTILTVEEVPNSEKLLKLQVDLGDEQPRQILSGLKQWYKPANLVGKQAIFVVNLEPRMMMGLESNGMILCADSNQPIILKPSKKVPAGAKIK